MSPYVKGNSEGIEVFPSGHLFWYSTAALQERWHWPVMKHFHAFTANTTTHGQNFPGSTSNSDPLSPGCPCCGPEVLHKKGQILIFFLRRLWIFLSGVSSWSQTHLSLLSVSQKESYFLVSKEDALFLFQSLSLSFPDHMMLEDQLSCLSSHLP